MKRHRWPVSTRSISVVGLVLLCRFAFGDAWGAGVVMVAGGRSEGELDETTAWSYQLYKKLIENGDINGDGKVKVAVVSTTPPTTHFVVDYFKGMGADSSEDVIVRTREQANDPAIAKKIADADVIFIRGGDQAVAYHSWKGTPVLDAIRKVIASGGAIGGTSSGAMALAGYAVAGGRDIVSMDVLRDSHSPILLDDKTGESGIHGDFLNAVPGAIIDTHVGQRARLGRLLGILAKAVEDTGNPRLLAIGVEERTGIIVKNGKAEVYGHGGVQFIHQIPETVLRRDPKHPLSYANVRMDVLTEGWVYDLENLKPDTSNLPPGTVRIDHAPKCLPHSGSPVIHGNSIPDQKIFSRSARFGADAYASIDNVNSETIQNAIGFTDAQSNADERSGGERRAHIQTAAFRALYDHPDDSVFLVPAGGTIERKPGSSYELLFGDKLSKTQKEAATIILDCGECTYKTLSPRVSNMDNGSETLHSAALIGMRVHVVGESARLGTSYDTCAHRVKTGSNEELVKMLDEVVSEINKQTEPAGNPCQLVP